MFYLSFYCIFVCLLCVCTCQDISVAVRGQLAVVHLILPLWIGLGSSGLSENTFTKSYHTDIKYVIFTYNCFRVWDNIRANDIPVWLTVTLTWVNILCIENNRVVSQSSCGWNQYPWWRLNYIETVGWFSPTYRLLLVINKCFEWMPT